MFTCHFQSPSVLLAKVSQVNTAGHIPVRWDEAQVLIPGRDLSRKSLLGVTPIPWTDQWIPLTQEEGKGVHQSRMIDKESWWYEQYFSGQNSNGVNYAGKNNFYKQFAYFWCLSEMLSS